MHGIALAIRSMRIETTALDPLSRRMASVHRVPASMPRQTTVTLEPFRRFGFVDGASKRGLQILLRRAPLRAVRTGSPDARRASGANPAIAPWRRRNAVLSHFKRVMSGFLTAEARARNNVRREHRRGSDCAFQSSLCSASAATSDGRLSPRMRLHPSRRKPALSASARAFL